jgi:amino acid transporter
LFNVAAVLGVQWIAASAHVGPTAIPLHISAALLFFIPSARVVTALSRRFPGEDGFPAWTRHAFGEWHGFLCAWSYWISVLLYLPGLLMAGAGMAAYALGPERADDRAFVVPLTLGMLWGVAAANLLGLHIGKWLNNAGASLIYLAGLLVLGAGVAVWMRDGSATPLRLDLGLGLDRVSFWAQIAFAYVGLELGTVMSGEVRNPERTVPRAVWISAAAVAGAYVAGTVSLLLVAQPEEIHPMTGIVGVAARAGERTGIPWLGGLIAGLLFAGVIGRFSTWAGGAARVPAGLGTPRTTLLVEAVACTVFVLFTQAGETLRAGWQVLTDMAILSTFLPFVYIFLCAWKYGLRMSAALGLFVTLLAIALSMVPPPDVYSVLVFELKVVGGCALLVALGWLVFRKTSLPSRADPAGAA